jgi:hypothetical protein
MFRVFFTVVAKLPKTQSSKVPATVKREPPKLAPLNFNVDPGFKREFKMYAASKGVSMLQLLKDGFELLKAHSPDD